MITSRSILLEKIHWFNGIRDTSTSYPHTATPSPHLKALFYFLRVWENCFLSLHLRSSSSPPFVFGMEAAYKKKKYSISIIISFCSTSCSLRLCVFSRLVINNWNLWVQKETQKNCAKLFHMWLERKLMETWTDDLNWECEMRTSFVWLCSAELRLELIIYASKWSLRYFRVHIICEWLIDFSMILTFPIFSFLIQEKTIAKQ